jgi:hypothetical protein
MRRPKRLLSPIVIQGKKALLLENDAALFSRGCYLAPSRDSVPEVGLIKPATRFKRVDLPQPLGPSTQTKLSLLDVRDTCFHRGNLTAWASEI